MKWKNMSKREDFEEVEIGIITVNVDDILVSSIDEVILVGKMVELNCIFIIWNRDRTLKKIALNNTKI